MPRFRKVYVNSSHRTGGTPTNFHFEFPLDLDCTGGEKCSMAVTSLSIPNVFHSIQQDVNDKLRIYQKHPTVEASSVNSTITIPTGNYTASQLSTQILNGLQAAALGTASYSVSYSAVTQRLTITQVNSGGFTVYDDTTLKNLGMKNPAQNGLYGALPVIKNPQSLQQVLNLSVAVDPAPSFTSGVITLARVTEAFLRSPNITNMSTLDSNGRSDVLKRVLIDRDFGLVVTTDSNIEPSDLMDVTGRTLRSVDFTLTDGHGNLLDLHGTDFSFALNFVWGPLE